MTTSSPDPLTSAFDEYAAFFEAEAAREQQNTWHVGAARRKGERLLAAVEAVRALADDWDSPFQDRRAAKVREAITRALTGEDGSHVPD